MIPLVLPDPIDIDRDMARREAQRELSKHIYHQHDDPLVLRVLKAALHQLDRVISRATDVTPGGAIGLVFIAIALVVLVVVIRWRLGPLRQSRLSDAALFDDGTLDADDHRRRADAYAAKGQFAEAVRERLRAVVRELEARGVLEPRNGRTADEAAREAGVVLPDLAQPLRDGAHVFDEIWYGGRTADAAADAQLRELDRAVRTARVPVVVS